LNFYANRNILFLKTNLGCRAGPLFFLCSSLLRLSVLKVHVVVKNSPFVVSLATAASNKPLYAPPCCPPALGDVGCFLKTDGV
jgi:hypothetical protein